MGIGAGTRGEAGTSLVSRLYFSVPSKFTRIYIILNHFRSKYELHYYFY